MLRNQSRKHQRGFSLAEILIAVAVFAIIFIAALMIYDRSNRVFKSGVESSATQQSTRVAFDRVVADLRMAGYDYDRDGIPSGSVAGINQYQQPDEQIEYVGQGAIAIRGNFDYETDPNPVIPVGKPKCDKGCEPDYVPAALQFPVVTTGNDEIVAYVLMSPTAPAGNPVTFYVDSYKPRKVFPGAGGTTEKQITITSTVNAAGQTLYPDQTNANPPYTLYRVSLNDGTADGTPVIFTPVADNIRSLTFQYYQDAAGTLPLKDLASPAVVIPQANLAATVGGLGQYDPANPTGAVIPRAIRGRIQAVRMTLVGMNEAADFNYTDPTETLAAMRPYRKYRLESLISPRNYSRRGFREQEFKEPGPPTLTKICTGYCGIVHLEWQAPAPDATKGGVESYAILYDTDLTGGFTYFADVGNTTTAFVTVDPPASNWFFAVAAVNSYGSAVSPALAVPYNAKNATKPALDSTTVHATGDGHPAHVEEPNRVRLFWQAPNSSTSGTITCNIGAPSPIYPIQETKGYELWRRVNTPSPNEELAVPSSPQWTKVLDPSASGAGAPSYDPLTNTVTFIDTTAANCISYWYKVKAVERCPLAADNITSASDNESAWSSAIPGQATSSDLPAAPSNLDLDYSGIPALSRCDNATNLCQAALIWPKVQLSQTSTPMAVDTYYLERIRKKAGSPANVPGPGGNATEVFEVDSTMYTELAGGQIAFTHTNSQFLEHDVSDSVNYLYEFRIAAKSCTTTSGSAAYGPMRIFPCAFAGGAVSMSIANTMQGTGTFASPWVISTPSTATATTAATVAYGRMTLYAGATSTVLCDNTGSFTSFTCSWPSGLADETTYRLEVFLQDAAGCTTSKNYFVSESNNNCCLTPQSVDATIVAIDAPSQKVTIRIDNNCSETLQIQPDGIRIEWNPSLLSGTGQKRLDQITYPVQTGSGTTIDNVPNSDNNVSPVLSDPSQANTNGAGKNPVLASSSSYTFDIHFNRTFTLNPITKVCITYRRPSDLANRTCKILPVPSNSVDVCD